MLEPKAGIDSIGYRVDWSRTNKNYLCHRSVLFIRPKCDCRIFGAARDARRAAVGRSNRVSAPARIAHDIIKCEGKN